LAPALAPVCPAETEVLLDADPLAPVCAVAPAIIIATTITAIQYVFIHRSLKGLYLCS
jgi:hypothetical protein